MSKQELKELINSFKLEKEVSDLIHELIDNTETVNNALLDAVADIIDTQAEFYERAADIFEEESQEYEVLAEELNALNDEELMERMEAIKEGQDQLLNDLQTKLQNNGTPSQSEPASEAQPPMSQDESTQTLSAPPPVQQNVQSQDVQNPQPVAQDATGEVTPPISENEMQNMDQAREELQKLTQTPQQ